MHALAVKEPNAIEELEETLPESPESLALSYPSLEELLDGSLQIRNLHIDARQDLINGLKALASVDPSAAGMLWTFLGTDTVASHAVTVGKYAAVMTKAFSRPDYDFDSVGSPLIYEVAYRSIIERFGESALDLVWRYSGTLFGAAAMSQMLGQRRTALKKYADDHLDIRSSEKRLRSAMGMFAYLYTIDGETARAAASVSAGMQSYEARGYVSAVTATVERLGAGHRMVKALLNPDKAEVIVRTLERYPQFPLVFSSDSETPISPSFYRVAGDGFEEMRRAAKAQKELIHGNHYDLETELIEASMPDLVRIMKPSINRRRIGLLDACTGDGEKFVYTMLRLTKGMKTNRVSTATRLAEVCLVDYNEWFIMDAVTAIESHGIAVEGKATGSLPYMIMSKKLTGLDPSDAQMRQVPVVQLTLHQGNIEGLVNDAGFQSFRERCPVYLTSMLGTTVCNFDPDTIARTLHDITSGYCLVSVYLDEGDDAKLNAMYGSEPVRAASTNNLAIAGVAPEDFGKFDYEVAVQRWQYAGKGSQGDGYVLDPLVAVVTYFVAREKVNAELFDFDKGQKAPAVLSIKPTAAQFSTMMAAHGLETAAMYRHEDVALFLLRKTPMAGSLQFHGSGGLTPSPRWNRRIWTESPA